jgi:uncharacterized membrane protein
VCERSATSLTGFTHSSRSRRFAWESVALVAASLAYPGIVYGAREIAPPWAFVIVALALVAVRLLTLRSPQSHIWRLPLTGAIGIIIVTAVVDPDIAAKAYPSIVSLMIAAVFGTSLLYPPSLIERFARLGEPDLPPDAGSYCRNVTVVWTLWLSANAVVSAILALRASDEAWALWTGLVAYIVMAALFAGELAVRRIVRSRAPTK